MTAMPEDDSSHSTAAPEGPERRRSWLERLSSAITGEPSTRDDLVELLRDAQADNLIGADTLRMMEGAIAVSRSVSRPNASAVGSRGAAASRVWRKTTMVIPRASRISGPSTVSTPGKRANGNTASLTPT